MSNDEGAALTLTRDDMYELVWSKPILELAKDFGISDVALAKRCRRLSIPVPGRGYWARVDAGQTPYRPKLPKREDQYRDHRALTVPAATVDEARDTGSGDIATGDTAPEDGDQPDTISARIAALELTSARFALDTLAVVKRTARHLKHSRRAELKFERGENSGPVLAIDTTDAVLDRALLLADTLLRAAEVLGWTFVQVLPATPEPQQSSYGRRETEPPTPTPTHPIGQLTVEGERIEFRIEERLREEPRVPTPQELAREKREYGYHAPRKALIPTGKLRVVRLDIYDVGYRGPTRLSWYDRKGRPCEDQIKEILLGFHDLALSIKSRRAEQERRAREREEQEQRQKEREARQAAHARLIKQIETDAGAWHRARFLRRYIGAAKRALGSTPLPASFQNQSIDFLTWATTYVDQLDPLHEAARTSEFYSSASGYYVSDTDKLKASFTRLFGSEWQRAWKLGADYTPEPRDSSRPYYYSYGEKSVFEVGADNDPADSDD
jgi:hypothetical protein